MWLPSQASLRLSLMLMMMLSQRLPLSMTTAALTLPATATILARGALSPSTNTASDTGWPFPPPLRTATTCTDPSLPLDTLSASPILVLLDLSSRGPSSTPATARGALRPMLMLSMALSPLSRTATTSTATRLTPSTPSASPILALPDLTSRCLVSTLASTTVDTTARGAPSPSTEELPSTLDTLFPPPTGLLRVSALDTASDTATASTAMARGLLYHSTLLLDPLKSPPPSPLLLSTAIRTLSSEPVPIPMESEITISHPHICLVLPLMNKFLLL